MKDALDAFEIRSALRAGEVSARELTQQALTDIEARNARLNCFSEVFADEALAAADAIDARRARGEELPPLAGVPVAVKNLFDVRGHTTIAGSKLLRNAPAAQEDAAAVASMKQAGAIVLGALHMDEFAYGFTTENSHYGAVRNPHDLSRIAGGSSGGSGSAVGAGLVRIALGSDTSGSIRVPSALCGAWGLKPSFGRLSRRGCYPFVDTLDHVGPLAGSARELALTYDLMQGPDARDPDCAQRAVEAVSAMLVDDAARLTSGLRIAVAGGYFRDNAEDEAWQAVQAAATLLGSTREIDVAHASQGRAAAFIITAHEAGQRHWPQLRERGADFEPLSRDRLLAGAFAPEAWAKPAYEFRARFRREMDRLFDDVDVILTPATPRSATKIGATSMQVRGQEMIPRAHMGMLTQPISFIGLPAAVAPYMPTGRMPVGVQIIAPMWREDVCLRVARALEMLSEDFRAKPAKS